MSRPAPLRWQMLATHVPSDGAGGGMVRYVVEMAGALLRHPDIELSVLTGPEAEGFFTDLIGDTRRVQTLPGVPTVARAALERFTGVAHRPGPYDVVHGTKHLLPRRSTALRVLTVHDMLPFDRPQDFGTLKRLLLRRPYIGSLADADLLVCVSAATRARVARQFPDCGTRSAVVPLAVSSSLLAASPVPVSELAGRRFAIVVGDPSPRTNLPLLVDAWDGVCAAVPEAVLALVGPPSWAVSSHGEAYRRLREAGRIVALGHVSDQELRWCYENAAVALCPSRLEGFGLPAVEALAFGAPLITSTDPALCEVSGDSAVHLSPDDPESWVAAIVGKLSESRGTGPSVGARSWDDVAAETVDRVRQVQARTAIRRR